VNASAAGQNSLANNTNTTASGQGSQASGVNASTYGQGSQALGSNSTSAGQGSLAAGANSTASGQGSYAAAVNSTATGQNAIAGNVNATALGQSTQAYGLNSTAVGTNSLASGVNSTSLGVGAQATGNKTTALGTNANVTANNSVALGSDSVATRGAQTYQIDFLNTQTSVGEVSVGSPGKERQITNVAAGSAPTDAVNMSQFNASANRMRQGIASAAALAGLVPDSRSEGNNQIAVSLGGFDGATSLAVGYILRTPVGITVRAAIAINGNGGSRVVSNVAASWGW
jgi:autotransporter adhesin